MLQRWVLCYGVTQREALLYWMRQAEQAALKQAAALPNGQNDDYDGKLRLRLDGVNRRSPQGGHGLCVHAGSKP
ncbi:MAG: hypothetical protein ABSB19_19695 [Methylomonas sp.]